MINSCLQNRIVMQTGIKVQRDVCINEKQKVTLGGS